MAGESFEIFGGKPLKGQIEVRGSKNAAFPVMAAALLTKEECFIDNLPKIEDIFRMVEAVQSLGAKVQWVGDRKISIRAEKLNFSKANRQVIERFRGSILLYGSLLARLGKVNLPRPGGCVLGARPIDVHLDVFSQLGAKVLAKNNNVLIEKAKVGQVPTSLILGEFSVTGTLNALLAAALLPQTTLIKIADEDYQVQELLKVLKKMGVKIVKVGHHEISIKGAKTLKGFSHKIIFDPLEAGTFIIMAAATRSQLTVKNVETEFLELLFKKLKDAGLPLKINAKTKEVKVFPFRHLRLRRLQALPFPGLQTDLLSALAVLATQGEGPTLIHDPLYEGRFKYLEELVRMGADIFFADPHRVIVTGPTALEGKRLGSLDIRSGAALIIAALAAKGKSVVDNIYQIDRGYERIEERLRQIGADIKRIKS